MKNLQIGRVVRKLLLRHQPLAGVVGNKVFPLVAEKGTTFPFIVYRRESATPTTNKDRLIYDIDSTVSIIVASDNYTNSIDIAECVIDALYIEHEFVEAMEILDMELINAEERYQEETFIQQLTYKIKIK